MQGTSMESQGASPIRLGLMGFGRMGRNLFRLIHDDPRFEVRAIAEVADHETLEYLLRFSTVHGRFPVEVSVQDGGLFADGRRIPILDGAAEDGTPWGDHDVDVVVELRPASPSRAQLERHLEQGARHVVLCVPPQEAPDLTAVVGINDDQLTSEHAIVSNASCTAQCAAPVLRILDRAFGVERAYLSSVHAFGNRSRLADVAAADMRSGRAAGENIIPQDTNAAEVLEQLMPELAGKLQAQAINVPIANGSVLDLVCFHRDPVSESDVNEVLKTAASASWRGHVRYETEPVVSRDLWGAGETAIIDSQSTMVLGDRVSKTIAWFDNTMGYLNALTRLLVRLSQLEDREAA